MASSSTSMSFSSHHLAITRSVGARAWRSGVTERVRLEATAWFGAVVWRWHGEEAVWMERAGLATRMEKQMH